ncbi:MAG: Cerebroside-sulfatase [Verrucomicrobia bacterium]|nr:MAG: Cerebroside-sulfatase [Verrucomicrobiota bacterium]
MNPIILRVLTGLAVLAASSPAFAAAPAAASSSTRPNIVLLLADDMGYGDVQALNPDSRIPTPNLNRLAAEGMAFTDAHTPSAVCTPTRYGLLTGRYCWRSRLKSGVLDGYSPPLIETERPTIASFLKSQGYATGIVGKWHLGLGWQKTPSGQFNFLLPVTHGPNQLGFDFSFIIPASLDFPPYVFIRNGQVTADHLVPQPAQPFPGFLRRGERGADLVMESCLDDLLIQATTFVREQARQKDRPFFLYFPLTAPHKPVLPHPRFHGQSGLGPYGDFVVQVDWTVGEVLQAIEEAGIADNTLVIYTSDNGSYMYRRDVHPDHVEDPGVQAYRPEHHRANGPWRGTKADIWEAGHRVPFFVRWPGRVAPATRCPATICLTDIFATLAEVIGAPLPDNAAPDSYSFLSWLEGRPPAKRRPPVIHHSGGGMYAIRDGQWKLVLGNGSGGRERPRGKAFAKPYPLFDLTVDTGEQQDLAERYPNVATTLEKEALEVIEHEGRR